MNKQTPHILALCAITSLLAANAPAAPAPPVSGRVAITLKDAVRIALEHSPAAAGAAADADASSAMARSAAAASRPSLSGTLYGTTGDSGNIVASSPGVSPPNILAVPPRPFGDANLTLMTPLFTGGRTQARTDAARQTARAAGISSVAARLVVEQAVVAAYAKAVLQRDLVSIAQARVDTETEQTRVLHKQVDTGAKAPVDLLRTQAELADAQGALATADSDAALAAADLKEAMGVSQTTSYSLSESLDFLESGNMDLPASEEEAVDRAVASRPEIAAAQRSVDAARAAVRDAKGAYSPQVYGLAMADGSAGSMARGSYTIGLSASLPLYNSGQRKADVQAAEARVRRAEADIRSARQTVERQAVGAWFALQAATARKTAADAGVSAAQKGYDLAVLRYAAGKSILAERLDARSALTRSQGALAQARADISTARYDLYLITSEVDAGHF